MSRRPEECPVAWCDETGEHQRHMQYLGSMIGSDFKGNPETVQIFAQSKNSEVPQSAIVLVDSHLKQVECELSWPQLRAIRNHIDAGLRRFGGKP